MTNDTKETLEEVLAQFVFEADGPTRAHVIDFIGRYPAYEKEIVDFAAGWAEQEALPAEPVDPEMAVRLARRMESAVLNDLAAGDDVCGPGSGITATLQNLARRRKRSLQDLARALGLELGVVQRLNARKVAPETVPGAVTEGIADYLASTVEQVYAALAGPGHRACQVAAESLSTPPPRRISYDEALRSAANDDIADDGSGKEDGRESA